jgi:hypothetical protein
MSPRKRSAARDDSDVHQSVLGSPLLEWAAAQQLLDTLREPRKWHESVSEEIRFEDERLFRRVAVKVNSSHAGDLRSTNGDLYLVLLKPRKHVHANLVLEGPAASMRMLSHREHEKLGQWAVLFRFLSVVRLLRESDTPLPPDDEFWATADDLVRIAHETPAVAHQLLARRLTATRILGWPWPPDPTDELTFWASRLQALCAELAERYYKIVKLESFEKGPRRVEYSFDQEQEERFRKFPGKRLRRIGQWMLRPTARVRRALAPPGELIAHVPWARLSDHYEMRMPAIDGYYVYYQRVMHSSGDVEANSDDATVPEPDGPERPVVPSPSDSGGRAGREPWIGRPRGRTLSPAIFIGDGTASPARIYVGVRYFEIPPGSTVRALLAHLMGLIVALGLVAWSFTHLPGQSADVAALVTVLVALGTSAAEGLTPRAPILNAPLVPRLLLYLQGILLIVLSIWLFVRGSVTESTVLPPGPWWAQVLDAVDPFVGWVVVGALAVQFGALAYRTVRVIWYYSRAAGPRPQQVERERIGDGEGSRRPRRP